MFWRMFGGGQSKMPFHPWRGMLLIGEARYLFGSFLNFIESNNDNDDNNMIGLEDLCQVQIDGFRI